MNINERLFELMFKHHELFLRLSAEDIQDYIEGAAEIDEIAELKKGFILWRDERGRHHRDGDKPAVIYADGTKAWCKHGKINRAGDQPAIIYADGQQEWWVNGKKHRAGDQPAVIKADGTQQWWVNGEAAP